jgi:hypothetical protein
MNPHSKIIALYESDFFFGNNCKDGWKQQAKLILANNAAGSYRTAQQTKATVQNDNTRPSI